MTLLHIQLRSPFSSRVVRSIDAPLGEVVGREIKLSLAGRTVSVDRAALYRLWPGTSAEYTWSLKASEAGLRHAHDQLVALVCAGGGALIEVKRAGAGPTPKSIKVTVKRVTHPPRGPGDECPILSHTVTVPASQLIECDGQWYAPRWLLNRTIHKRILDGKQWPQHIEGGVWLEADHVWRELWTPMLADVECLLAEDAAMKERRAQEAAARQVELAEQTRRGAALEAARLEAKKAREQAHLDHLNQLDTIGPIPVEWDDWETRKNSYGSKTRVKVTQAVEACTLKFSGERVYLLLPDGAEIIKARHNVRWVSA
jgi:hypothetical protein